MNSILVSLRYEKSRRYLVGLLLAVCLLLRALIPAGFMPGNLLAGEFMILCPQGMPTAFASGVQAGHGDHHSYDDDYVYVDASRACPIGSALVLAAAPPPGAPQVLSLSKVSIARDRVAATTLRTSLPRRYQSRAPPQSAA